jgi:hypothetical protein
MVDMGEVNDEPDCRVAAYRFSRLWRFKSSVLPAASDKRCKASWLLLIAGDSSSTAVRFIMGWLPSRLNLGAADLSPTEYTGCLVFLKSVNCAVDVDKFVP